jgi:hypothetical protein
MIEAVGYVGPGAHVQLFADPFEGHGGLGPEAFGNANLALVSFEGGVEVFAGPVQAVEFCFDDALGLLLFGFFDFIARNVFAFAAFHRRQEFFAKVVAAEHPAHAGVEHTFPDRLPSGAVPCVCVAAVEAAGVGAEEPFHASNEVGARGFG